MIKIPKAPSHLSAQAQQWFKTVVTQYELDESGLKILVAAGECWDRSMEAREIIQREGLVYQDKFLNPRKHPAVDIELNSKLAFSRLVKTLGLPAGEETGPMPGSLSHKKKGTPCQ